MPAWIAVIHRIIITVSIKIKSVRIFGINILGTIRRDKSTPFGIIISRIEVVEFGFSIVVITAVSDGVIICQIVKSAICYLTVTPSIISIFCLGITTCIVNSNNVALKVSIAFSILLYLKTKVLSSYSYINKTPLKKKKSCIFCRNRI